MDVRKEGRALLRGILAGIIHEFSAAGPGPSALTALPTLGLLDRVHDYDCGSLGTKALSAQCFRPFASKRRALSGLENWVWIVFWFASANATVLAGPLGDSEVVVRVHAQGAALQGALVESAGQSVVTDAEGLALLTLPAGAHRVRVTAEGFLEEATTIRVQSDVATEIEVKLSPVHQLEEEIFVSATRSERRLTDQPLRVEVVDREEIEEKALMTPGSIAMLLAETTGLRVQTTAPSTGAANVRIQGLRGRYTQLLSDGLPLFGLQGNSLSLLQVPPLDLGQVEIIKGAASALYGPSALGGVINLVSQRPLEEHREILLNLSTQEALDLTFWAVQPPKGNFAFTLLGGLHGQRRQDLDADGWADLPTYSRGVLRPRIFWEGAGGKSVFATVGVSAENRRGGTTPEGLAPDGRPFPQNVDSRQADSGGVMKFPLSPSTLLTVRGSFSYRAEERVFGEILERGQRTTGFGEVVLRGATGKHVWVIGGAIQQDHFHHRDLEGFDFNFVTPALIAQDEIQLSDKFTLGVSARLDRHSEYGTFASPRISLLAKPSPEWTVRLSGGAGFFAPTPFVEETEETGFSRLQPWRGLKAEKARSASVDTSWNRGPVEVLFTVFGSIIDDPVEGEFVDSDRVALINVDDPVRTWGTELLGRYRRGGFLLLATHNFTSSTEGDSGGAGRHRVSLTPTHSASLNAIWEDESWGRFGIETYYTGHQPLELNPFRSEGRSYVLVGALLEKRFRSARLFVNFENLTNVRQTRWDPLVRPTRLPDGRWTVDAWAPLDGRVVNGGIRWIF